MKFQDLTREISNESLPFPGDPPVLLTSEADWEHDRFRLRILSFPSNQGRTWMLRLMFWSGERI